MRRLPLPLTIPVTLARSRRAMARISRCLQHLVGRLLRLPPSQQLGSHAQHLDRHAPSALGLAGVLLRGRVSLRLPPKARLRLTAAKALSMAMTPMQKQSQNLAPRHSQQLRRLWLRLLLVWGDGRESQQQR
jgi:hypothetical protein